MDTEEDSSKIHSNQSHNSGQNSQILMEIDDNHDNDVMRQIEDFVKPRRGTQKDFQGDDVYEMCDQFL